MIYQVGVEGKMWCLHIGFLGVIFLTRTHSLYRHTLKHGVVLSQNWPGLTHSHKF